MAQVQILLQLSRSSLRCSRGGILGQAQGLLPLSACDQHLSALSTSAAAARPTADAHASLQAGEQPSTSGSNWSSTWPWVSADRPQVLPVHIPGTGRPSPISLDAALKQLQHPSTSSELSDAVRYMRVLLQDHAASSPTHSVDVAVRFLLDPRRSDHLVRGSVVLPHGTGKAVRVAVFAKGDDADLARQHGADIIGDEALINEIIATNGAAIRFDKLIATPDFMKPLAKAGRVLGPKGLMPNPKLGTLTQDVSRALRELRQGRLDYRLGKDAMVRAAVGKVSMPHEHVLANLGGLFHSLLEARPKSLAAQGQGLQGYLAAVTLRSSQSAGQRVTLDSCEAAVPAFLRAAGLADSEPQKPAAN